MIYDQLFKSVAADLKSRGCPLPFHYGRRWAQGAIGSSRVVFLRDRDAGDQHAPPTKGQRNPTMGSIRQIGAVARVFAASTLPGADEQDHERIADQVVDLLLEALRREVASLRTRWRVASMKLLTDEELALRGITQWPGVVYELTFSVDRGVYTRTWVNEEGVGGDAAEEVEVTDGMIVTSTKVTGPSGGTPETACP